MTTKKTSADEEETQNPDSAAEIAAEPENSDVQTTSGTSNSKEELSPVEQLPEIFQLLKKKKRHIYIIEMV